MALRASAVHEAHCSDVVTAETVKAGRAMGAVSAAWTAVGEAHEATPEPWLLYWRGLLAQCLGQEERALADLEQFLDSSSGAAQYAAQRDEAARRVELLEARLGLGRETPVDPRPIALTLGLGAGAGVLAGLGAWQAAEVDRLVDQWHGGGLQTAEFAAVEAELRASEDARGALFGIAGGIAAGAVVVAVVGAARRAAAQASLPPQGPWLAAAPRPDGVTLVLGGRW